jgi:RNA polymerase sigma-70 factor (ECF subfamily)
MVDDVAQEVCVAVFGALGRYRDEGRPFEAFVYGIAARKVADAQRAIAAAAEPASPDKRGGADKTPSGDENAVRYSEVQHIMSLVDKLPETYREIVRLRIVSGMTAEETGRALGMTPGAVRVAQHRALNLLRGLARHDDNQDQ